MIGVPFVDLAPQHAEITPELDALWSQSIRTSSFIGGPAVAQFEQSFAEFCAASSCVGVANGTDALELILEGLGIGAGDDVLVPANTFVATAEAVVNVGARPVFVDVDPESLLVTAESLCAARTNNTRAAIVVHLFGSLPDMDAICAFTQRAGILLIEDAAQAHGATWRDRPAGSFGVAASFSFYPGKNLGAFGDGGAVVTSDASLAEHIRSMANHGRGPTHNTHLRVGRNSRLDALQAGLLSLKLDRLADWNERRRRAHGWYRRALGALLVEPPDGCTSVHHLEVARVPDRAVLGSALDASGIGWGVHYPVPCHRLEAYGGPSHAVLPNVEKASREIISLPMFPTITQEQVHRVCTVIRSTMDS